MSVIKQYKDSVSFIEKCCKAWAKGQGYKTDFVTCWSFSSQDEYVEFTIQNGDADQRMEMPANCLEKTLVEIRRISKKSRDKDEVEMNKKVLKLGQLEKRIKTTKEYKTLQKLARDLGINIYL